MENAIKALIIDDEPLARKGLLVRLESFPEIDVVGEAGNGREGLQQIKKLQPDLIFLDIQMPGLNGFQLLQELHFAQQKVPLVVFVTAYDSYAIRAFDVHALDYLLKPVDENRLLDAIQKVQQQLSQSGESDTQDKLLQLVSELTGNDSEQILQKLADGQALDANSFSDVMVIKDGNQINRVPISDIRYIDAAGDYMCVHVNDKTLIMRKTMKELEQELDPRKFVRVHRSSMVNIQFIDKMVSHMSGEYCLVLTNGEEVKVSRSYRDNVKAALAI